MSWQAYVDDHLVATGKVAKAAIIGLNGAPWAQSPTLQVPILIRCLISKKICFALLVEGVRG